MCLVPMEFVHDNLYCKMTMANQKETGYYVFDRLILASAIESGSYILYSEDMQNKQLIDDTLRIINPFI